MPNRISANLGFLWTDRPLPKAIEAAAAAGFEAVECHMPYDVEADELGAVLSDLGLPMISLNTRVGDPEQDEFGLAALPGREAEARKIIDEAVDYAVRVGCPQVSVIAGRSGRTSEAEATYRSNLEYAAGRAKLAGIVVLIEPLSTHAEDYHLVSVAAAAETIAAIGADNVAIMFDCYHVHVMGGDVLQAFDAVAPHVGHVQIASVPDRAEPDGGVLPMSTVLEHMIRSGYRGDFGAEYNPSQPIEDHLDWHAILSQVIANQREQS